MNGTWLRRIPFLGWFVSGFGKPSKSDQISTIIAPESQAIELTVPTSEPPPLDTDQKPAFSTKKQWRYNLEALEEMLDERMPDSANSHRVKSGTASNYKSLERIPQKEVSENIKQLNHIPILKTVSERFQMASQSVNADLTELSMMVRRDPGLNTKILRMINSSYFHMETEVTDIEHAMVMLGINRIRYMAQTLGAVNVLNRFSTGFDLRHLWSHSFSCGLLAENLSQQLGLYNLEHAYSAGLLHDIGKIILSSMYPHAYRSLLRTSHLDGFELNQAEQHVFGCDHEEAGGLFSEVQKLPVAISQAMQFHSDPLSAPEKERDTAAILFLANHYAKEFQLGFSGNPQQATSEELVKVLRCLSSGPLEHCLDDASAHAQLAMLYEFVFGIVPGIQQEVDELLRVTFGRSLPKSEHSPIPFKI